MHKFQFCILHGISIIFARSKWHPQLANKYQVPSIEIPTPVGCLKVSCTCLMCSGHLCTYIYQLYIILCRLVYCGLETLEWYRELEVARKTSPIHGISWSSVTSSGRSMVPSAKIFSSPAPSSSVLHLQLWKEAAVFDLMNAMFDTHRPSDPYQTRLKPNAGKACMGILKHDCSCASTPNFTIITIITNITIINLWKCQGFSSMTRHHNVFLSPLTELFQLVSS